MLKELYRPAHFVLEPKALCFDVQPKAKTKTAKKRSTRDRNRSELQSPRAKGLQRAARTPTGPTRFISGGATPPQGPAQAAAKTPLDFYADIFRGMDTPGGLGSPLLAFPPAPTPGSGAELAGLLRDNIQATRELIAVIKG